MVDFEQLFRTIGFFEMIVKGGFISEEIWKIIV